MTPPLPDIVETRRLPSPVVTPQSLAWHEGQLWIGSRDEHRVCAVDAQSWKVVEEIAAPGIPWASVGAEGALYFTSGEGPTDDRYLRRYLPGKGFDEAYRVPCPELTGSYLSSEGGDFYLSQWYKHRILRLDASGQVRREIGVGAEISGHVFVDGLLYVLRGTEQNGENWHVARLDPREETPRVDALARVPFACRSLAFDGQQFWTNHRATNETVAFSLPMR